MSQIVLVSDTLLSTPVAGTVEYNGQFYGTDSNASRAQLQRITQGTAVTCAGQTSIDFTGIPSWAKKITLMLNGVSTSGTSIIQVQLGDSGGIENTALGVFSLYYNTSGSYNTAIGLASLQSNTTASNNTAVGYQAGYANTTGTQNAFFGRASAYANTTGNYNSIIGDAAGYSNTTGSFNTVLGQGALYANTTASYNTAVGYQAGYSNTTGIRNTFLGEGAGFSNTTSSESTYVGRRAGYLATGANNAFFGEEAGISATTGTFNTFIGTYSGSDVTTGTKNTILGRYSGNMGGLDIRTSSNYIVLSDGDGNPQGYCKNDSTWQLGKGGTTTTQDGVLNLNGSNAAGRGPAVAYYSNGTYVCAIGTYGQIISGTGTQLTGQTGGSGGVQLASGATAWSSASDPRLKEIIGTYTNALVDIAQIQPIKFTWKSDEGKKPCVGVDASTVVGVVPEAVDESEAIKDDETKYLHVRYTELIPLMIAAIKELKAEIDLLKGN
jgi:hypothetical protein